MPRVSIKLACIAIGFAGILYSVILAYGYLEKRSQIQRLVGCARTGDAPGVKSALAAGAPVDGRDGKGLRAIDWAAREGKPQMVALLVHNGSNLEQVDGHFGLRPLEMAAWCGEERTVRLLLDLGADVAGRGTDGTTALHMAADTDQKRIVQLLLAAGAPKSARDSSGMTALDYAVMKKHADIVSILKASPAARPAAEPN